MNILLLLVLSFFPNEKNYEELTILTYCNHQKSIECEGIIKKICKNKGGTLNENFSLSNNEILIYAKCKLNKPSNFQYYINIDLNLPVFADFVYDISQFCEDKNLDLDFNPKEFLYFVNNFFNTNTTSSYAYFNCVKPRVKSYKEVNNDLRFLNFRDPDSLKKYEDEIMLHNLEILNPIKKY